jgi:hypothetical protein
MERATRRGRTEPVRYLAAGLAVVAGLIHFAVAPDHFAEAFEFGSFMVLVGTAQVAAGLLLLARPTRALVQAALVGTVVVFLIYAVSRTTGLPFGPEPFHPEAVGLVDLVSKATEALLLMSLIWLLR